MKRIKLLINYVILIIGLVFAADYNLNAEFKHPKEDIRKTVIDSISVNSLAVPSGRFDDIVLTDQDSIEFYFTCLIEEGSRNPFLFRIELKTDTDSSNHALRVTNLKYKNMPEQKYTLTIEAFDPEGKWKSSKAIVRFRVDNKEANLRRKLDSLQFASAEKDSLIAKMPVEKSSVFTDPVSIIISSLTLVSVFALFWLSVRMKKMKSKFNDIVDEKENMIMKESVESDLNKKDMIKAREENNKLKGEIAALRGQIDAMQARSTDLIKQNKDLEESVNKLNSSKEELEKLQEQKDDLFAMIIHDIKNPASLIKSLVELLRSYDLTATEQQEVIQDIVDTTSKIVTLSQEVSRILALEGGRMVLDKQKLPINEVIGDIVHTNTVAANKKKITLLQELDEELPDAAFDFQKIAEVVDNILSNAIKFTQDGGTVKVRSYKSDQTIVVDISDNGLGLSEEDIKNAFQRGSQLSAKPTAGESSTGLGLWIVKKLVDAHKGRVWVRSAMGKGSTFSFSLPLEDEADSS